MFALDFCYSQIECSELAEQCDSSNPQFAIRNSQFFPVYPDWVKVTEARLTVNKEGIVSRIA